MAKVNGVAITAEMLNQAMEERLPATGHRSLSEKRISEIQREELDKLVVQEVLVQEARKAGIKVGAKEVEAEIDTIKSRFTSEAEFEQAIERRGLTMDMMKKVIERHLLVNKLREREVDSKIQFSDQELKKYYDDNAEKFRMPEQIRLRLILISVDPSSRAAGWDEARTRAEAIAERARGGEDFAAMAKEFSGDRATRDRGGDTGLLHQGRLRYDELEHVVFTKAVGEVGDPVRTLYGYIVYKVEEKKAVRQLKYDEINKDLLTGELKKSKTRDRTTEWIAALRDKAEITIY